MLIGLALLLSQNQFVHAQEYKKITRLGTNQAVCLGGVDSVSELQSFVQNNPNAVADIIRDAGSSIDADELLNKISQGDIVERTYPVGTRLLWTSAKIQNRYVAKQAVEWAGASSFEAFQINLTSGCRDYDIVIPKACCNISLYSVKKSVAKACQAKRPEIKKVVDAPITKKTGAFYGSEKRARFRPEINEDQADSSDIYGIRLGLSKSISDRTSIFTQLSYYERGSVSPRNVASEDNFALDVGVERKVSEALFIAAGIGAWNIDDDADFSVFAHIGGDILQSDFQWFIEGRLFDSDATLNDSLSDNKMISAGVRYLPELSSY